MTLETEVAALTTATTSLLSAVNVSKTTLDQKVADALTSENNASTSASNAATSENNASTSASNASTSASNASTSASNASTSASNAATSETNAATSASNAATSAGEAASAVSDHATSTANPHSVTKAQVGLGSADNTSDADKPVSTATQSALNLKAPLESPSLTGTPTAPTAAAATNTTQIATTAFVRTEVANLVAAAPAALDTLNELSAALGNDANFATTVTNALAAKAPLASPGLTGTPTAPTAAAGTNSTQLATTAHVFAERSNAVSLTNKTLVDPAINGKADLVAIDKTLFPAAIVDSFIYDTTKDTDGGAWRDRCSHLSWYKEALCAGRWLGSYANETAARVVGTTGDYYYDTGASVFYSLNVTSGVTEVFRGNRAGFPAKVLITAESNRVVLWDLDNGGSMWMVFDNHLWQESIIAANANGAVISGVYAINGQFVFGKNGNSDIDYCGLRICNFASDVKLKHRLN